MNIHLEANGLWIKGKPGSGKSTTFKLLLERYPGQVFPLKKRASSDFYDTTALLGYNNRHKVVLLNDLKGVEKKGEQSLSSYSFGGRGPKMTHFPRLEVSHRGPVIELPRQGPEMTYFLKPEPCLGKVQK